MGSSWPALAIAVEHDELGRRHLDSSDVHVVKAGRTRHGAVVGERVVLRHTDVDDGHDIAIASSDCRGARSEPRKALPCVRLCVWVLPFLSSGAIWVRVRAPVAKPVQYVRERILGVKLLCIRAV